MNLSSQLPAKYSALDRTPATYAEFSQQINLAEELEAEIAADQAAIEADRAEIQALEKQKQEALRKAAEHALVAKTAEQNLKVVKNQIHTIKIQAGESAAKSMSDAQQQAKAALAIMVSRLLGTNKEKGAELIPADGSIRYDIQKQRLTITELGMAHIIETSKRNSGFKPGNFKIPGVARDSVSEAAMIRFIDAIPQMNVDKVILPFALSSNEIAALVKAAKSKAFEVSFASQDNQTSYNAAKTAPSVTSPPAVPPKPTRGPGAVAIPIATGGAPQLVPNRGSPPKGQA